jgi:LuxR family transcriptional regulator, maltose regulon positive regulatory protein
MDSLVWIEKQDDQQSSLTSVLMAQ